MRADDPRRILGHGLVAVAKSALLVAGVPAALIRLWYLSPRPAHGLVGSSLVSTAGLVHVVLVGVGVLWAWAALNLVRDLSSAVRHAGAAETSSWSTRWAASIAGLLLFVTAGSATASAIVSRPGASRPAATAVATTGQNRSPSMHGGTYEATNAPEPARTGVVSDGECLSDFALRTSGARSAWVDIARANLDSLQSDGTRFVDASLLRSGWCLAIAPGRATPTVSHAPVAAPGGGPGTLEELGIFGLGILTTAAVARRVRALRRLAESARRAGERTPAPAQILGDAESLVVPLGEGALLDWIDAALRLLGGAVAALGPSAPRPEVELVRAGPEGVEFLLDRPIPDAPRPFVANDAGHWWTLPAGLSVAEAAAAARGLARYVPWLVPLGDDGDAVYLVALGPGRRLTLDGARRAVDAALAGITAALRTLPWADELEVELIGIDAPPPSERSFQLVASSAATLGGLAAGPGLEPRTLASPTWRREPFVIVGSGTEAECPESVLAAVGALAGIVAPRGTGTCRLVLGESSARIEPFGVELRTPTPDATQLDLLDRLFGAASSAASVVAVGPAERTETPSRPPLEAGAIEVRLLSGPASLSGLARPPAPADLPRVTELLAYLTLHGHRATPSDAAAALYGREDEASRRHRLANTVAAARAALPARIDGAGALSPLSGGELRLDPLVSLDWTRFSDAVGRARDADPDAAVALLRFALRLLGEPVVLGGGPAYDWLVAEGLLAEMVAGAVDAAHHLATLAIAADDFELATWAASRGRLVEPASEMLLRDLLVALDGAGEHAEMRRLAGALEDELVGLGGNEPSPETRALLAELLDEGT